ncbi:MAG: valine--tRNA ligase [Dehalococcoidia bacterium]|nr:valine--tRNA ligase [Dehalococcoidia bacterium]
MPRGYEMSRAYSPEEFESPIYEFWLEKGFFSPKPLPNTKPFVIIMPPPNVTGQLHLGHALTAGIQDILTRWRRMKGDPTLWLPGKDHAGIATQVVVERELAEKGITRQELGREEFVKRIWTWVDRYGQRIDQQHKKIGASCDWSRLKFTLDPEPSLAVQTTFVNLHKKGLIYRGERIINWCVRCATALSDLEVDYEDSTGTLFYVNYSLVNSNDHITIATTRPETIMGDTGVAIHPNDERFNHLVGEKVVLPIVGRQIPIVADTAIKPDFGTGVLKVTPGHDHIDFEIGQRSNLPIITVIDTNGVMNNNAGPFEGQDRFKARKAVIDNLRNQGLLFREESISHAVGHCQRCHTIVEPLISKQWFIKIKPLADPARESILSGKTRIVPEHFSKVYDNWMKNIRDWCISRQLWWGHRIPVWYCENCNSETVSLDMVDLCKTCGSTNVFQDPDVLDTWFSSGLWPHSTLGWPNKSTDLDYFYPTSVMVTGYDILFFWVARMMMLGIENTGTPPFHTIYLHGLVKDADGIKMSKTKGNVLDPITLIETYGTDALRFALTTGTSPGNDIRLGDSKLASARNFANKLWNVSRFVINNATDYKLYGQITPFDLSHREDRWIRSRLNETVKRVEANLDKFEIGEAQREIYEFVWSEFCDWYVELAKVRIRTEENLFSPIPTLIYVLEKTLRLLHPFMPFITEEIWQRLTPLMPRETSYPESIMIANYPIPERRESDSDAEAEIQQLITLIRAIRNIRAELKIEAHRKLDVLIDPGNFRVLLNEEAQAIKSLANLKNVELREDIEKFQKDGTLSLVAGQMVAVIPLGDVIDVNAEKNRITTEIGETRNQLQRINTLLNKPEFISKAPGKVVDREKERATGLTDRLEALNRILSQLSE